MKSHKEGCRRIFDFTGYIIDASPRLKVREFSVSSTLKMNKYVSGTPLGCKFSCVKVGLKNDGGSRRKCRQDRRRRSVKHPRGGRAFPTRPARAMKQAARPHEHHKTTELNEMAVFSVSRYNPNR